MKWILHYLMESFRVHLCFGQGHVVLASYINAYKTSDITTQKSTFSFVVLFVGGTVS